MASKFLTEAEIKRFTGTTNRQSQKDYFKQYGIRAFSCPVTGRLNILRSVVESAQTIAVNDEIHLNLEALRGAAQK